MLVKCMDAKKPYNPHSSIPTNGRELENVISGPMFRSVALRITLIPTDHRTPVLRPCSPPPDSGIDENNLVAELLWGI